MFVVVRAVLPHTLSLTCGRLFLPPFGFLFGLSVYSLDDCSLHGVGDTSACLRGFRLTAVVQAVFRGSEVSLS